MNFVFSFNGFEAIQQRLAALADATAAQRAVGSTLFVRASKILAVSQRLVPVDLGVLRASGTVYPPTVTNGKASVLIAYGGAAAPYAFIVHEDLGVRHRVGSAKYLEIPFNAEKSGVLEDLKATVMSALRNKNGWKAATALGAFGRTSTRAAQSIGRASSGGPGF